MKNKTTRSGWWVWLVAGLFVFRGYFLWLTLNLRGHYLFVCFGWAGMAIAFFLIFKLAWPRWRKLCALAVSMAFMVLAELYVAPMHGQIAKIVSQTGVDKLVSLPGGIYRWVLPHCQKNRALAGLRNGPGFTALQRGDHFFKEGSLTAENAALDCALNLLFVGDLNPPGSIAAVDLKTMSAIARSQPDKVLRKGITFLDYDPLRKRVVAGHEETGIELLSLVRQGDLLVFEQTAIPLRAVQVLWCKGKNSDCFYSAHRALVRKHDGGGAVLKTISIRGKSLPQLALDSARRRLFVSDWLGRAVTVLDAVTLKRKSRFKVPLGIRYIAVESQSGALLGANWINGWLYRIEPQSGKMNKILFTGFKTHWLYLAPRDQKLYWCAASACYRWRGLRREVNLHHTHRSGD